MSTASEIVATLPDRERQMAELALHVVQLRQCLGYFIEDPRFTITVGGNPHVVQQMIARVKRVYADTK